MSEQSYRDRALKLFPWICARCAREFSGRNLRELTVHHKDHDHHHNPEDGSNWELLCLYCHDNEHSRQLEAGRQAAAAPTAASGPPSASHKPFAALKDRLKEKP